jgi:protein-tyrosine-phosphatase
VSRPQVLVACVKNAGRSVAAKLLLEHYGAGLVDVRSAGSEPGDAIHGEVAAVLQERGLDTSREVPKLLTPEVVQESDVVVTMGCGETCPVFPGKRYLDWPTDDPNGQPVEVVRRIVDDIDARVRGLLTELVPGAELPAPPRS